MSIRNKLEVKRTLRKLRSMRREQADLERASWEKKPVFIRIGKNTNKEVVCRRTKFISPSNKEMK